MQTTKIAHVHFVKTASPLGAVNCCSSSVIEAQLVGPSRKTILEL